MKEPNNQITPLVNTRYCSYCGSLMLESLRPAEENLQFYPDSGGGTEYPFASEYNKETGKRNYCHYLKCRYYEKKRWFHIFSPHDEYFIDKVVNI